MVQKIVLPVMILLCLLPPGLSAQTIYGLDDSNVTKMMRSTDYGNHSRFGIFGFDPSRLKINQSYSMFFSSFGNNSITQGMYLNTMSYQFAIPLTMSVQWGFTHQPFSQGTQNSKPGSQLFISGAELKYQPSENMVLKFQFYQAPAGSYYYSPYNRMNYNYGLNRFYPDPFGNSEE